MPVAILDQHGALPGVLVPKSSPTLAIGIPVTKTVGGFAIGIAQGTTILVCPPPPIMSSIVSLVHPNGTGHRPPLQGILTRFVPIAG